MVSTLSSSDLSFLCSLFPRVRLSEPSREYICVCLAFLLLLRLCAERGLPPIGFELFLDLVQPADQSNLMYVSLVFALFAEARLILSN
jgi:hypothetical protein